MSPRFYCLLCHEDICRYATLDLDMSDVPTGNKTDAIAIFLEKMIEQ